MSLLLPSVDEIATVKALIQLRYSRITPNLNRERLFTDSTSSQVCRPVTPPQPNRQASKSSPTIGLCLVFKPLKRPPKLYCIKTAPDKVHHMMVSTIYENKCYHDDFSVHVLMNDEVKHNKSSVSLKLMSTSGSNHAVPTMKCNFQHKNHNILPQIQTCVPTSFYATNLIRSKINRCRSQIVKSCQIKDCKTEASRRQCEHNKCKKLAQGKTRFCISHGGGRRCTYPGCDKGARDKLHCVKHGGGKRCNTEDCRKSAIGGCYFCVYHGGGKRYKYDSCTKCTQGSSEYCIRHGGSHT